MKMPMYKDTFIFTFFFPLPSLRPPFSKKKQKPNPQNPNKNHHPMPRQKNPNQHLNPTKTEEGRNTLLKMRMQISSCTLGLWEVFTNLQLETGSEEEPVLVVSLWLNNLRTQSSVPQLPELRVYVQSGREIEECVRTGLSSHTEETEDNSKSF